MSWWGAFIGGVLGMQFGGPLGAVLGAVIGHNVSATSSAGKRHSASGTDRERVQLAFYSAVFSVMGAVCKADGRVSQDEIAVARHIMRQMKLNVEQQQLAMELFDQGKEADFSCRDVIMQLKQIIGYQPNLYRMFVEIQISAAYADHKMHSAEHSLLLEISQLLDISASEFKRLCVAISQAYACAGESGISSVEDAYTILGVDESVSDHEVKLAYRRLISQHHPDKLVSKGLPEEMMKLATKRTHEIRQAYERIKKDRQF